MRLRRVELQHGLHQLNRLRTRVREQCAEGAPLRMRQGFRALHMSQVQWGGI